MESLKLQSAYTQDIYDKKEAGITYYGQKCLNNKIDFNCIDENTYHFSDLINLLLELGDNVDTYAENITGSSDDNLTFLVFDQWIALDDEIGDSTFKEYLEENYPDEGDYSNYDYTYDDIKLAFIHNLVVMAPELIDKLSLEVLDDDGTTVLTLKLFNENKTKDGNYVYILDDTSKNYIAPFSNSENKFTIRKKQN